MVSVVTTHLRSTLVAHAGGKLFEHFTAAQARYSASISSCGLRPNPALTPQDFRTMSGVLGVGTTNQPQSLCNSHSAQLLAYGRSVKRLLARTPQWVIVLLGVIAVVGFLLLSDTVVTPGWKGWPRWVALGAASICAAISFGVPQWQQWKIQQESQLRLDIEIEPGLPPSFASLDDFIDTWVHEERHKCLASLTAPITSAMGVSRPAIGVSKPEPGDAELLGGVTLRDILLLQKRGRGGEALTDQEEAVLAASRRMTFYQTAVTSVASLMAQPDARSPEQYLEEVEDYLARCSSQMRRTAEWQHVHAAPGLTVTVVNPTDRVFESVQVEIHLPGEVSAIAIGDLLEPMDFLPNRPRSFGEPRLLIDTMAGNLFQTVPGTPRPPRWPRINNSHSVEVKYEPVPLRPRSRVALDIVHLLPRAAPGTTLEGTWSATATNARGKICGRFTVTVGQDFPTPEALGTLLTEADRRE
jgi:hypothetical protein